MTVTHEPWLVLLSILIAIQGSFVGLRLAVQIPLASGVRRRTLLAGAALSLGIGIWSMHFIGMLAARLPAEIDFLVFPTLLSFLVCVLVVGLALVAVALEGRVAWRLAASSIFMGAGIATMHYIGMSALHGAAHLEHAPWSVVASIVIAIIASGGALWLAFLGGRRVALPVSASAVALGLAISGMHYTAMAGLTLHPMAATGAILSPVLSSDLLAILVAVVAFLVTGVFFLILVPDRSARLAVESVAAPHSGEPMPELVGAHPPQHFPGTTALGPLGGVGSAPLRYSDRLPAERDGATLMVAIDQILAIHANAHYTYIFTGTDQLFCSLSIGEVEKRLDPSQFARVHRSHIVSLRHVSALRRVGDHGMVQLNSMPPVDVPVSRAKIPILRRVLSLPEHPLTQAAS
jgi:NO-binding membrane sensor protein with MHYT domain